MISRMLLVSPRCVCWEYAEAQHRSTTTGPMVDFSTAVSSGHYGSAERSPAGGLSAAAVMTRPCGSSSKDYTLPCGLGIVAARCGILTLARQPLSKGLPWVISAELQAPTACPVRLRSPPTGAA